MSSNNILSPANGDPIIVPPGVVLGCTTDARECGARGEGMYFSDVHEAHRALQAGAIEPASARQGAYQGAPARRRRHARVHSRLIAIPPLAGRCCPRSFPGHVFDLINQT